MNNVNDGNVANDTKAANNVHKANAYKLIVV